jgi:hypothetical protein
VHIMLEQQVVSCLFKYNSYTSDFVSHHAGLAALTLSRE